MRLLIPYGVGAVLGAAVAVVAISPFATTFVDQWSRRDVELRSTLVFNSVRDELASLIATNATAQIDNLFERLALDERLRAVGFCSRAGVLLYHSKLMPADFSCEKVARSDRASFSTVETAGLPISVGAFPVSAGTTSGHLVLLHDLTFAQRRGVEARTSVMIALAAVALVGAALASVIALLLMRGWLQSVRRAIDEVRTGRRDSEAPPDGSLVAREIRHLFRQLDDSRRSLDAAHADWNAETLRLTLANHLPGTEIIVVSNREPYIHNRSADGVGVQTPASGLVAAIEPVMRACGGTWIAHGSGSADREVVDARDRIRVPPEAPAYTLRRVWLSDEEQDGYYYGFANEGLWPLCHIAFVRPTFRQPDWERYRAVNARFAQAVLDEVTRPDPIIMVQDYHFALLPAMIREQLPSATIITFWHIPWPNSESFGICPWKEEIVSGLLGSTVLGFHTQFHCNNFIDTVDRFIESRIDREHASITVGGHETFVRPYPISIEWPPAALAAQQPIPACRAAVRARLGLPADIRLAVGIERFDYTKGIVDRMRSVDRLLTNHPEWQGRFAFVQVAAPTRSKLSSYSDLQTEARALADEINSRYADAAHRPIMLVVQHYESEQVFELFRAADICIVSSLHDGMNLVAKEFVAARDDEQGVLILSNFAGASRELSEALIVNPYDAQAMSEVIHRALFMPQAEQRARMQVMREIVRVRNVHRWAAQMLLDAAQLRKRQEILEIATHGQVKAPARPRQRPARLVRSR
ncbi:MAG TPA: trehalose-6-phosphate synthase [Xanthobacteraceae bacterium]